MITIKEIAELAGTSRGTVDRVLNGRGNVNGALADRIRALAQEHDYKSNPFAKALVSGKRVYKIGVVINSKGNRFFDDVLRGIHDDIRRYSAYGMELVLREIKGYNEQEQLQAIDEITGEDLAALAITPMDTPAVAERLAALAPLPIVTFTNDMHLETKTKLAFIGCDYLNSGRLCGDVAALALPQGGRVAVITGSFQMLGHNQRIMGFREALSANRAIRVVDVEENNDDNDLSYQVTSKVIRTLEPDLIYFCAAGTEGGVKAVKDSGRPIQIVVVDDLAPMRRHLAEGTVCAIVTQQPYRQGSMLMEILYNYLVTGRRPEHVHNYMENQVRLRHSK